MSCAFASVSILSLVFLRSGTARGCRGVWGHGCTPLCADAISHPGERVGLSHVAQALLVLEQWSCSQGLTASLGELQCESVLGCHS